MSIFRAKGLTLTIKLQPCTYFSMKNSAILTHVRFIFAIILTMGVMLTAHCHFSYKSPWHSEGKAILYRPGKAVKFPGVWGFQIPKQSVHEGGNFVSPTHRRPLPLRKCSWYSFLLELGGPQGHSAAGRIMSMKNYNALLDPWRWDRYVVPKRRYGFTILRYVKFQKITDFNFWKLDNYPP